MAFFHKYWDALDAAGIPYATHLGKYRPENHATKERLRKDYPNYDKWVSIRDKFDPDQVFVTGYWRKMLALGGDDMHAEK